MKASWHFAVFLIFLFGLFLTVLVGTSTSMTFIWPGYFVLGLAGSFVIGTIFHRLTFSLPRWTMISVFVLGFYLLMRASESQVAYFAREDAALVLACFLAYAGVLGLCSTAGRRRGFVLVLAFLVAANLLFALLQAIFGPGVWLIPGYERTSTEGAGGLFNQPDHYAAFVAASTPLWFGLAMFGRDSKTKCKLWCGFGLVCTLAVLVSGSMAGMLTFAVGMGALFMISVFLLWKRLKPSVKRNAVITIAFGSLIGGAALYLSSDQIAKKLGHGLLTKNGEASLPVLWDAGLRQIKEAPLLGTGSRSSYIYSRAFRSEELSSQVGETEFIHNEYLQMLGDYGALGLVFLLLVLALHLRSGYRFVKGYRDFHPPSGQILPRSDYLAMTVGAIAALASLLAVSGFDFAMHLPAFAILAATLLATLAAPDPMANAIHGEKMESILPGGGLMFSTRAVAFGCGIAMVGFGFLFSQSEFHYEKARLAFEKNQKDFKLLRHLKSARDLDPQNPFAQSLSAHAMVAGITSEMAGPARQQALEKADQYFSRARHLYPQDVFAAVGHAAVMDELGKKSQAKSRLEEAKKWAPLYGNLILAQAEHHLRYGQIEKAEESFREALSASAFRDAAGAETGLKTISEWKFIAQQNGIQWNAGKDIAGEQEEEIRVPREAKVVDRAMAGEAIPEPAEFTEE